MKIVAIGGGENGRITSDGTRVPYEIKKFDEEIVNLTGKSNPNYLFIGFTQSKNEIAEGYFNTMKENFSLLGCVCEHLREIDLIDMSLVEKKIKNADIIYVGGGNTLRLMNILRKYKINKLLEEAGNRGCVLCGVSAGAICWHNYGNSDSRRFTSNSTQLIRVSGLGFIDALFCPHYDVENGRQEDLKRMMKNTKGVALAFENCTALKIVDDKYEVLKCKDGVKAYKCYFIGKEYIKEEIEDKGFVIELVNKNRRNKNV